MFILAWRKTAYLTYKQNWNSVDTSLQKEKDIGSRHTYNISRKHTYLSVVYRNDTPRDQDVDLQSQNYLLIQLVVIPCGTKFLRVLIFAIFAVFSTIRKKKFPRKKFPTKIFFAKIYSTVEKSRKLNDEIEVGTLFTVKISKEKDRLKVPHLLMD